MNVRQLIERLNETKAYRFEVKIQYEKAARSITVEAQGEREAFVIAAYRASFMGGQSPESIKILK